MPSQQADNDVPVEVLGYVTDAKLVGYQILTNYESLYWRRLVGRDAWALYEVLRSFCHEGNNVCNPSIRTLMDILGLTDRRQLIGRVDDKPGRQRVLPGLIDLLQENKLAFAEVKGAGPYLRYTFHVNLNPPALTPEQVVQLPSSLQKRHAQLLQRVAQSVQKLDNIEAQKPIKPKKTLPSEEESEGGGTVPPPSEIPSGGVVQYQGEWYSTRGGVVQYQGGDGTVPSKQHPYNNTHTTTTESAEKKDSEDNNIVPDVAQDVVVALIKKGVSEKVAGQLADRYEDQHILEKIAFLDYVLETDPQKVSSPGGWLRRAIEEDFSPPAGFGQAQIESSAPPSDPPPGGEEERAAEVRRMAELDRRRQAERGPTGPGTARRLAELEAAHGTGDDLRALWSRIVGEVEARLDAKNKPVIAALLHNSSLLAVQGEEALIALPTEAAKQKVKQQLLVTLQRLLARELGLQSASLRFITLDGKKNPDP